MTDNMLKFPNKIVVFEDGVPSEVYVFAHEDVFLMFSAREDRLFFRLTEMDEVYETDQDGTPLSIDEFIGKLKGSRKFGSDYFLGTLLNGVEGIT